MVWPMETCPSPARATRPWWRTQATVVAWKASGVAAVMALVGARMRPIVHLHQMLCAHVRVALGGAEAAVAQELLDEPQIRAFAEHVGGEGVAQRVGADATIDAGRAGPRLHDAVGAARRQPASPRVGEERPVPLTADGEPCLESLEGDVTDGHHPLLAALA